MLGTLELLCQPNNPWQKMVSKNRILNPYNIPDFGIKKSLSLVHTLKGDIKVPSIALNSSVLESFARLKNIKTVRQALDLSKQYEEITARVIDLGHVKKETWSSWVPSDKIVDRIHHTAQLITEALPKEEEKAEQILPAEDRELLSRISNEPKSRKRITPSNAIAVTGIIVNLVGMILVRCDSAVATKYQKQIIANQEQYLEYEE